MSIIGTKTVLLKGKKYEPPLTSIWRMKTISFGLQPSMDQRPVMTSQGPAAVVEPIYVETTAASGPDGPPTGLQLTTITVAVPAGPLSPGDQAPVVSAGASASVSHLLHSTPLPTVPLPLVPDGTVKWKHLEAGAGPDTPLSLQVAVPPTPPEIPPPSTAPVSKKSGSQNSGGSGSAAAAAAAAAAAGSLVR